MEQALAILAEHGIGGNNPEQGHGPGQMLGQSRGQRGGKPGHQGKTLKRRERALDLQGACINQSGRGRTGDFLVPAMQDNLDRAKLAGISGWKKWTTNALLRAGFAAESSTLHQVAKEIDGASPAHAGQARLVVARAVMQAQEDGVAELQRTAQGSPCSFFLRNIMFDESSFDLKVTDEPASVHSVLCSHGQWTFAFAEDACLPDGCRWKAGKVYYDEDVCRPPRSMEAMNSQTMWLALATGQGGLAPAMVATKHVATLTINMRLPRSQPTYAALLGTKVAHGPPPVAHPLCPT